MSKAKSTITPTEQAYRDAHSLTETPKCPICGKNVQWSSELKRYKVFCCTECRLSEQGKQITHQMQVQKMLETKGVANAAHLESTKQKRKETLLEKYGVEHYSQTDEYKEKYKKTCLERFGVENSLADRKIRESIKQQWEEKTPEEIAEIIAKRKETSLKNWGVDNPSKSDEVQKKISETSLKNWGVEHMLQSDSIRQRQLKTYRSNHWDIFIKLLEAKKINPLFTKEEYIDYILEQKLKYQCLRCNNIFETDSITAQKIFCKEHIRSVSGLEVDVRNWIKTITYNVINNKYFTNNENKKYTCDIFLPEFNIGIEFNGIYWHSNLHIDKKYHQEKYLFFKEQNIQLIQIFENEWCYQQDIVKSIILSKLHCNKVLYARKCETRELSNKEYELFCETNHLQGNCNAKVKLGLFHNNELVQTISLSKPRFNKSYQWELIRSCTKLGCNIAGGFNKLITYFKRHYNPESIITYCDARYFNGVGYQRAGFEFIELTECNGFYWHRKEPLQLIHRTIFQKHLLSKKLKNFDPNKTAELNMIEHGYLKIYDAGNLKFVWTNKKKEESEDSSNI